MWCMCFFFHIFEGPETPETPRLDLVFRPKIAWKWTGTVLWKRKSEDQTWGAHILESRITVSNPFVPSKLSCS